MTNNPYAKGLDKCAANYAPLTPLDFLERSASVYPEHIAVIDGAVQKTWKEIYQRCRSLASALAQNGIGKNDTVAVLAPNSLVAYECHFAVPMSGAVLNPINTRLDVETIAFILEHGEAKVFIVDYEVTEVAQAALKKIKTKPLVINVEDESKNERKNENRAQPDSISYEEFLASGDSQYAWQRPEDEWDSISLSYTSGTTGDPKGVVYHHRGAYLNALSNIVGWQMPHHPVYLWTLPMFHCNGWCFPWSLAAIAGTSICLRQIDAESIFQAISKHRVTHFCGAPIIMNMLINADKKQRCDFSHTIEMMTAAAPPPAAVLAAMEESGFRVTHVYGLTETYGPAVICSWHEQWNELSLEDKAEKNSRQGVRYHALEGLDVFNPETMQAVKRDGKEMGETMFRGNIVMKGYLKNPKTTTQAFADGWFHSGDLGVIYPDNYLQLKDRSKDIIISGGENISSIEVEDCLYRHPAIMEAAVVAKSDEKWGETPCAFVQCVEDATVTEQAIIDHCREKLAHFKVPSKIIFGELPKTSTGKIQKFKLRKAAEKL